MKDTNYIHIEIRMKLVGTAIMVGWLLTKMLEPAY